MYEVWAGAGTRPKGCFTRKDETKKFVDKIKERVGEPVEITVLKDGKFNKELSTIKKPKE